MMPPSQQKESKQTHCTGKKESFKILVSVKFLIHMTSRMSNLMSITKAVLNIKVDACFSSFEFLNKTREMTQEKNKLLQRKPQRAEGRF